MPFSSRKSDFGNYKSRIPLEDDYKVGDPVEAVWGRSGRWYEGEVAAINEDGTYKIFWPEWGNYSESVTSDNMKPVVEEPCDLKIGKGASIQYRDDQLWYPATIIEQKDESGIEWFKFHYDGFPDEMDEWIAEPNQSGRVKEPGYALREQPNTMIGRMAALERQDPWRHDTARTILIAACDIAQTYALNNNPTSREYLTEEQLVGLMQERMGNIRERIKFETMEALLDVLTGRKAPPNGPGRPATEEELKKLGVKRPASTSVAAAPAAKTDTAPAPPAKKKKTKIYFE